MLCFDICGLTLASNRWVVELGVLLRPEEMEGQIVIIVQ